MATKKKRSSRAKRAKQPDYAIEVSMGLFAAGALLIVMLFVEGQSLWSLVRTALFGFFGVNMYLLGVALLYLAVLVARGEPVWGRIARGLFLMLCVSGVAVIFSSLEITGLEGAALVRAFLDNGSQTLLGGGLLGIVAGGGLLAACGRPAANIIAVVLCICAAMLATGITPAEVWEYLELNLGDAADGVKRRSSEAKEDYELHRAERDARRAERQERLEELRAQREQEEAERAAREEAEEEARETGLHRLKMNWFSFFRKDAELDEETESADDLSGETAAETAPADPTLGAAELVPPPAPVPPVEPEAPAGPAPAAKPQPKEPPHPRASFDIDLGPDPVSLTDGDSEPIEPIQIGPGGTFGRSVLQPDPAPAAGGASAAVASAGVRRAVQQVYQTPEAPQPAAPVHTPVDEFSAPIAPAAEPELILPDGSAPVARPQPAPVPAAAPAAPKAPARDEGWMSIEGVEAPKAESIETLAAAAMAKPQTAEEQPAAPAAPAQPEVEENVYHYPPLDLFEPAEEGPDAGVEAELKANAQKLVDTLLSFGVETRVLDISRGPAVTRYELQPKAGVKISKITSLADDIALNLAAKTVRIEAPIPGKPAVGIEISNRKSSAVNIRGILESQNYQRMTSPLTIALGKDIAGVAQVADLCKMPHLLIAGSTGSGKSVCVNSIIISFVYRSSPEDVKLMLIDPKVVELAEYNGIPHLLMPVITEPRKAAGALGSAVAEMERRYHLFADNNVRDIKTYNKLALSKGMEKLPYIAIVIDELADLMMVAGKEVEDYICRIAQKARAAGMHLIVATQRPSVDVITGLIKANIPSRIAFAVSSQVDSRTILDGAGAEKLLGNGDMLFMPVGASKPIRIQGTYVRDEEITRTLDFIKSGSTAMYNEAMIAEMEKCASQEKGGGKDSADDDGGDWDPMLKSAAEVVIDAGQASTSLLQRRCKLGYARAARIMDEMEQLGIIGPYEGAKPRAVLISRQQWLEMNLNGSMDDKTPEQLSF